VSYLASMFGAKVVADTPTAVDQADIKLILGKDSQFPQSFADVYDGSVRPIGYMPPVVETPGPKPVVKPAATATMLAQATALAAPRSSVAAVRPSVTPRASIAGSSQLSLKPSATAIKR
ncbi:MAG TPA: hypothetical protein VKU60_09520, partial [Chloroflexota bacterium]|nr:hypothetical protein [Chloroflexota bacterium]